MLSKSFGRGAAASVFAITALATATLAHAQVSTPPQLPHEVVVFPQRDFVRVEGYAPNADLFVQVRRPVNGTVQVVGDAVGRTDASGVLAVNHPLGVCWRDVTPDILPDDIIRVTYRNTANNAAIADAIAGAGDAVRTVNVTAQQAVIHDNGTPDDPSDDTVKIYGTARTTNGAPIPLGRIDPRIINPDFTTTPGSRIGWPVVRATRTGGRVDGIPDAEATVAYDPIDPVTNPHGFNWTATFTGLNEIERQLALDGQTRVLAWQQITVDGDRLGLTVYEVGETGGPRFRACPSGPGAVVPATTPDEPVAYDPANLLDSAVLGDGNPLLANLHDVIVLPERDLVVARGFPANVDLQIVVRRPDLNDGRSIVGTARGNTGQAGILEVNQPGGVCWSGQTPDIKAGDQVDVFQIVDTTPGVAGGEIAGDGETQLIHDVAVTRAAFLNPVGNLIVRGTAAGPDGLPIPLDRLEVRIVNPDFSATVGSRLTRSAISANATGGRIDGIVGARGTLRYVSGTAWLAAFTQLNDVEKQLAMSGQARATVWSASDVDRDRFGTTIYQFGAIGGPGFASCAPRAANVLR
jgi:hypothetical protein